MIRRSGGRGETWYGMGWLNYVSIYPCRIMISKLTGVVLLLVEQDVVVVVLLVTVIVSGCVGIELRLVVQGVEVHWLILDSWGSASDDQCQRFSS